ncbi:type II toxin-antitoxin system RelE/ParE family toxin, partial [Escherichia coli]|uniref:type II toxin-antitoxin system RelE/ParE family toxin n=1 Tax=Escherichia coli TaxID=562 RepID=UPI003D9CB2A2
MLFSPSSCPVPVLLLVCHQCEPCGCSASSLAAQPYKGRNGRVEGTRELVIHPHFVLVYEVDSQWGKVYILRVLHTAQKWP